METTHPREYKSPRRKLLRFFEKSRDKWKLKYREVKKVLKRLTNRIRFLERSKAEYQQRVEELQAQLAALKASRLEKEEANEGLKKGDQPASPLSRVEGLAGVPAERHHYRLLQVFRVLSLILSSATSIRGETRAVKIFYSGYRLDEPGAAYSTARV
jgi:hypothetical protein